MPVAPLRAGQWALPAEAARYVGRVLRKAYGDALLLFDGEAMLECEAIIVEISASGVVVDAQPARPATVTPSRQLTLLQAIGKGDKLDQVVRDATELGATRVVPLQTRRTVVRLEGTKALARAERWRKIASEAARQSGRGDTPQVDEITDLEDASSAVDADLRLVLVPTASQPAGALLTACPAHAAIALLVGPEGGLDDAEIALLERAGWQAATLGPRVLRTETVAAALLGALLVLAPA